jgi:hypothetical protein
LVDSLLVGRKLGQIDTYLKQIGDYSKISLTQYKDDWKQYKKRIIKYLSAQESSK